MRSQKMSSTVATTPAVIANEPWLYESALTPNMGERLWREVSWADCYEANKVTSH